MLGYSSQIGKSKEEQKTDRSPVGPSVQLVFATPEDTVVAPPESARLIFPAIEDQNHMEVYGVLA